MLDIGISEIAVIAVVALVVIGPERLPKVARTIGTLMGRAQRYVNDVKAEVNREMELDELRKLQTQMQDAARGIQQEVSSAGAQMHTAMSDVEKQLQDTANSAAGIPAATPAAVTDPAASIPTPLAEPPLETAPVPTPGAAQESTPVLALPPEASAPMPPPAPAAPPPAAAAQAEPADMPSQTSLFPEHTIR